MEIKIEHLAGLQQTVDIMDKRVETRTTTEKIHGCDGGGHAEGWHVRGESEG